ncbi:MAG: hypothetical protein IPL95_13235 [Saprospiraceae bacterium]|nr:hypothetical protein [Saprospiraceae bacterium]
MKTKRFHQLVLVLLVMLSMFSYIFLIYNQEKISTVASDKKEQINIESEQKSSKLLPDFEIITTVVKTISKYLPSN